MPKLTHIFIYPIKGLPGIECTEAMALVKGFKYDRRFMLVDEAGNFISQRQFPELTQFSVSIQGQNLEISFPSQLGNLEIELNPTFGNQLTVSIWNDSVLAIEPNSAYSEWFSNCLQQNCRLVYMAEDTSRQLESRFNRGTDTVSFADGFPYLLCNTKSLAYLNGLLAEPILMSRFRPNLVFDGSQAFEEDNIHEFSLGGITFQATRPCGRCNVITINQETGIQGFEPLKTLKQMRSKDNKVFFGENTMLLSEPGIIRVGMELVVHSQKKMPPFD